MYAWYIGKIYLTSSLDSPEGKIYVPSYLASHSIFHHFINWLRSNAFSKSTLEKVCSISFRGIGIQIGPWLMMRIWAETSANFLSLCNGILTWRFEEILYMKHTTSTKWLRNLAASSGDAPFRSLSMDIWMTWTCSNDNSFTSVHSQTSSRVSIPASTCKAKLNRIYGTWWQRLYQNYYYSPLQEVLEMMVPLYESKASTRETLLEVAMGK